MKRAALYARTSTEKQKDEATIESQIAEVENQIKLDGNILLPTAKFVDDGWSGELLARPALDQMRDSARKNEFEVLYVYDRGRLARKFAYQELVLEELIELGIEFITLHDVKADTPEEKVLQSMQGVFHEYERVKIAERMRRGKLFKTRGGKLLGYNPLFGYDYIHKQGDQNGYFVIDESEAEIVRKIFHWIGIDGCSILEVVKKLYQAKIYPPKSKREFWVKSTIDRMVKNESSIGNHYYYKSQSVVPKHPKTKAGEYKRIKKSSRIERPKEEWIKISIPPIIDEALFNQVQENLKLNAKFASRNKKNNYLLSGLVYCTCGMKRVGEKSAEHLYYRCADRIYNYPLPRQCMEKGISAPVLDNLVYQKVSDLFDNKALIKKQVNRWVEPKKSSYNAIESQRAKINEKLSKLSDEEQRYLKAFGSGITSYEAYENQMKDLNSRKLRLQNDIIELESTIARQDDKPKENADSICSKAVQTLKKFRLEDKQNFVRKVINQVIANQKEAIVRGFLPLNFEMIGDQNVSFKLKDRHCWTS